MPNTWSDPYAQTTGPQYKTSRANNASEQVLGLYQSSFGRSASSPEVDTWIKNATQGAGSAYLSPDQLNYIQGEFKKAPEYASYTGHRPTVQAGDYIPGVTLGTRLDQDEALRNQPVTGGGLQAEQETTNAALQTQIRERLMGLLDPKTPSPNEPALQPAISAFNAAQNKATARQVNQHAEAFGASGLESSGARLSADRAAIEQQGLNEATFASNLQLQELENQRQQLQAGLQMALALNDQDTSRRLQERLAMVQAQLQRDSLTQQGKLAQSDIDLRQKLGYGNLNLGMLGLQQQGRQFNDSLGFNLAQLQTQANRDALLALMGG